MDELLQRLCDDLDAEAERQEMLLAVCRAQLEALGSRDLKAIEARTAAVDILVREAAHAQATRTGVVLAVARKLEAGPEARTLGGLIRIVPEPWAPRLRDRQSRLKSAIDATRRIVRLNARTLRRSLDLNHRLLMAIAIGPSQDTAYSDCCAAPGIASTPALIDQRG